jgi:hypothetical protein
MVIVPVAVRHRGDVRNPVDVTRRPPSRLHDAPTVANMSMGFSAEKKGRIIGIEFPYNARAGLQADLNDESPRR